MNIQRIFLFMAALLIAVISGMIVFSITDVDNTLVTLNGVIVGAILSSAGLLSGYLCRLASDMRPSAPDVKEEGA